MNPLNNSTEKNSQRTKTNKLQPKLPRLILPSIFAFSPNRNALGGISYLLLHHQGNILIDVPAWHDLNHQFCQQQGGVKYLFFTNRDAITKEVKQITTDLDCELIIQEQEAYFFPYLHPITFSDQYQLNDTCTLIWTTGYSPGSSCLYYSDNQGVLFSGRHLLPIKDGNLSPLKLKKTFHWQRQLRNVQKLCDRFSANNLNYVCPASNTGYLRGKGYVDDAYQKILIDQV